MTEVRTVTVAIPVYNGASEQLGEILEAVHSQELPDGVEVEILISDSESTDGSAALAEKHGARVIPVLRSEFSHGGTRNMLVGEAKGEVVAMLTQDSTPASDQWLASILDGFAQAPDVALVFGPQLARPGHSASIARDLEQHFRTWGDGERIDIQRLGDSDAEREAYRAFPGKLQFFSDANGALAKWAWQQIPYQQVAYSEDQLLGREMIEAGYAKVFHPGAAVIHSHDYPPLTFLRRYFDEYRSLREVIGHVEPAGIRHWARAIASLTRQDRAYLRAKGATGWQLQVQSLRAARHHLMRCIGSILGSRADRLSPRVRGVLSLDGRTSFEPVEQEVLSP